MSEIDIVEDEARQQEHLKAIERGDLRCDYKITLRSTTKRRLRRPFTFSDEGYILTQQQWTAEQIKGAVISAIKTSFELQDDYAAVDFWYALQPYDQTRSMES